jgi:penicillin amidase
MLTAVATLALLTNPHPISQGNTSFTIERDSYGVPIIRAKTTLESFEGAGYAAGQDRLWQMELSRRLSQGRLAEVLGPSYLKSDQDTLRLGYTDAEIDAQVANLSPEVQARFAAYAKGVNEAIADREAKGTLPANYTQNGFKPSPWTVRDSAAITIHLMQLFGSGGGGELRTLALLNYLKGRPQTKDHALDIIDDLAWINDKDSPTTLNPEDDPVKVKPVLQNPTRKQTEAQLQQLPKASLFDLLPGLMVANQTVSKAVAMNLAVPFKTGSYCIVVSPSRSATKSPLLLSGPQMGFTKPSIAHEMALRSDEGLNVTGLDVPGVPGVLVGGTPSVVWGITTGVADVEDVYASPRSGDAYSYGRERDPIQHVAFSIPVKGRAPASLTQLRTRFGPVLAQNADGLFSLRRAFAGKELASLEGLYALYQAHDAAGVEAMAPKIIMSFNLFFATSGGEIGWRYEGQVPLRNPEIDPRFPTPGTPENEWRGMIPADQMPHVINPKKGLIVNWNNKPATWWPNGDTPVWGAIFRNREILETLKSPKLGVSDLEAAIWTIARRDETWRAFAPFAHLAHEGWSTAFTGLILDGSREAAAYESFFPRLRKALFSKVIGDLMAPDFFNLALQPSFMLRALQHRTKFDYLRGRKLGDVIAEASHELDPDNRYKAPSIRLPGVDPIPYSNRGTYIQILELSKLGTWFGRSVLPPGETEEGPHSTDQADLSRAWTYKPSFIGKP